MLPSPRAWGFLVTLFKFFLLFIYLFLLARDKLLLEPSTWLANIEKGKDVKRLGAPISA